MLLDCIYKVDDRSSLASNQWLSARLQSCTKPSKWSIDSEVRTHIFIKTTSANNLLGAEFPSSSGSVEISKSHNAPVPCATMHHSEQKWADFCSEQCIMGYGTGALWDLSIWSIGHQVVLNLKFCHNHFSLHSFVISGGPQLGLTHWPLEGFNKILDKLLLREL